VSPTKRSTRALSKVYEALDELINDGELSDLERLRIVHELHGFVGHHTMPEAVEKCLDHGETWASVADTLGLKSRQAAQQQWGRRLTARRLPTRA
jgi:hypothetical protein